MNSVLILNKTLIRVGYRQTSIDKNNIEKKKKLKKSDSFTDQNLESVALIWSNENVAGRHLLNCRRYFLFHEEDWAWHLRKYNLV